MSIEASETDGGRRAVLMFALFCLCLSVSFFRLLFPSSSFSLCFSFFVFLSLCLCASVSLCLCVFMFLYLCISVSLFLPLYFSLFHPFIQSSFLSISPQIPRLDNHCSSRHPSRARTPRRPTASQHSSPSQSPHFHLQHLYPIIDRLALLVWYRSITVSVCILVDRFV